MMKTRNLHWKQNQLLSQRATATGLRIPTPAAATLPSSLSPSVALGQALETVGSGEDTSRGARRLCYPRSLFHVVCDDYGSREPVSRADLERELAELDCWLRYLEQYARDNRFSPHKKLVDSLVCTGRWRVGHLNSTLRWMREHRVHAAPPMPVHPSIYSRDARLTDDDQSDHHYCSTPEA